MNRLAVAGLAMTVAGLLLVVGFWPLTSVSGADLLASKNGNQYNGYTQGSQITVHERVIDVTFTNFFGNPTTTLYLEDGDPSTDTFLNVRGDARNVVSPGDVIFAFATLQVISGFYYWEVASPGNVHRSWPIDTLFYGIMAAGVVVLAVAAFRKRRGYRKAEIDSQASAHAMSELGEAGARRIEWAREHMPVLAAIREELKTKKTLQGLRIGMALHVEAKTGVLALSLREAGAIVRLASCNPLSTDDSVATALAEKHGLDVYAKKWQTNDEYYSNLHKVLDLKPGPVIHHGADLVKLLHTKRRELLDGVRGANAETTTGVIRLRAMGRDGVLRFPVIDVNDAQMKHPFDNRYGTGQSTFDGLMDATDLLIAGKTFVVAGEGLAGRGVGNRARGAGAPGGRNEGGPAEGHAGSQD